jgi:hypothetical protein
MQEAQEVFEVEFDAAPSPVLDFGDQEENSIWRVDLDAAESQPPPPEARAQAFTIWVKGSQLSRCGTEIGAMIAEVLLANPFTTLQVVLESTGRVDNRAVASVLDPAFLNPLLAECLEAPTYLDKFYALLPGRPNGAKRLVVLLPLEQRSATNPDRVEEAGSFATVVWRSRAHECEPTDLDGHEFVWVPDHPMQPRVALEVPG